MNWRYGTRLSAGVLILAALACWTGCSTTIPAPQAPEPAPPAIPVDGDALPAIAFDEVQLEIPDHLAIGYRHEGLDRSRVSEYRWGPDFRHGRPALDDDLRAVLEGTGYRLDTADPRAVRLVARMVKISINSYEYKSYFEQVSCEMTWELWRAGEKRPYFTSTTAGGARVEGNDLGVVVTAFDAALHRLLADPEFVAAVGSAGAGD